MKENKYKDIAESNLTELNSLLNLLASLNKPIANKKCLNMN